jgi:hypothetical protein
VPWTGIAVQLHNPVRQPFLAIFTQEEWLRFDVLLSNYFFQISEQRHFGHRILVVIARLINFTPVSSTVVRHINVIDGNDPSSIASVTEAENIWYSQKHFQKKNVYVVIGYSAVFLYVLHLACQYFMYFIMLGK